VPLSLAEPEMLLDEYVSLLANGDDAHGLSQVLRFIENHSNWDNSLPKPYRLKPLNCGDVTSAAIALERLAKVVACAKPLITLPEPPPLYLERLQQRLGAIAAGNIGAVAPIVRRKVGPGRKGP
jgi:hypothetical protein